ncbi:hypothetical protein [Bacillus massiliglaciei]|uniref:hypothetical protein n=1 Tax=Bacillus massiliglaciei TaxID=1816693 RepID=UPI000ADF01F5|nr:hypothetical protein [Bacillus massiliglaciei]
MKFFRSMQSARIEVIPFNSFINNEQLEKKPISKPFPLFSFIPLHQAAMIDPVFIGIAAGILLLALIEKGLADTGNISIAAFISAFLRISFPAAGLGAIWYLVNDLKFLFW